MLAVTLATGALGAWNLDMSRSVRETLPDYDQRTYYSIWLAALERLLDTRADVLERNVAAGHVLRAAGAWRRARQGLADACAATAPQRFQSATACARTGPVDHHTRLPSYAWEGRRRRARARRPRVCRHPRPRSGRAAAVAVRHRVRRRRPVGAAPTRVRRCRSTPGSRIWRRHERGPRRRHRPPAR